jgi:hypothetical protein
LTPTGDDLLCGFVAARWCTSREGGEERRFLAGWGARLAARLHATSAVSATFLECALHGCFPAALRTLAATLADGRRGRAHEGLRGALDRVCAHGHSSGMDAAAGFLFGLVFPTGEEMRRYAPSF